MTASACRYTMDGANVCELELGHLGSHRYSSYKDVIGDGRGVAGQWVPLKMYNELREHRDEVLRLARQLDRLVCDGACTHDCRVAQVTTHHAHSSTEFYRARVVQA